MKRAALPALVLALALFPAESHGQHIDAKTILMGQVELLEIIGEAKYFDALGEPGAVQMSGNLSLYWRPFGYDELLTNYIWLTSEGIWNDSYTEIGDVGYCYFSAINARVSWWSSNTVT